MEFSDLDNESKDRIQRDAVVYENIKLSNVSFISTNELDATELQNTREHYEEVQFDTPKNEGKHVKEENKRDTFQWKDQPKEMRYIIYTLSLMLVILYIIVITVVVVNVKSLPKDDTDGLWTHWSPWSNCDVTCNNGTQTRTRLCLNPSNSDRQPDCIGESSDSKYCNQRSCDGGLWSDWESWGSCSNSCDGGIKRRFRSCINSTFGKACEGGSEQVILCNKKTCDDSAWSIWGTWGPCSESCDGGVKSRLRKCTNPKPSILWKECNGSSQEVAMCNKHSCGDHKVAFLAYGSRYETTSTVIKFPRVIINYGNGYSSSTGRFTCRISGIYNFAVTLTKPRRDIDQINAYLRINGSNKLKLHSDPSDTGDIDYGSYSLSVTGNFHLNTNDYVCIYSDPKNFVNDYSTSFTGVLVIPDD